MRFALIAALFLLLTSAWAQEPVHLTSHAEVARRSTAWPLEVEWIRTRLQQNPLLQALNLSPAQIFPPPDFTTRVQDPELEIRRIQENLAQHCLFITLRCRQRSQCASFLVEVTLPKADLRNSNDALLSAWLSPGISRKEKIPVARGPVLVQPHTLAMLVMKEDGLRITEPVLPEKRARLGEIVRVKNPSAHRSIMAKVIGSGLLVPAGETDPQRLGRMQ